MKTLRLFSFAENKESRKSLKTKVFGVVCVCIRLNLVFRTIFDSVSDDNCFLFKFKKAIFLSLYKQYPKMNFRNLLFLS